MKGFKRVLFGLCIFLFSQISTAAIIPNSDYSLTEMTGSWSWGTTNASCGFSIDNVADISAVDTVLSDGYVFQDATCTSPFNGIFNWPNSASPSSIVFSMNGGTDVTIDQLSFISSRNFDDATNVIVDYAVDSGSWINVVTTTAGAMGIVSSSTASTYDLNLGGVIADQFRITLSGASQVSIHEVIIDGSTGASTYTVGGTVSGLTGSVTLQNNDGDDIIKTANDGFTFAAQAEGSDYLVTVSSQPAGQTCAVTNGSGSNLTANITNVTVTCVTDVVPGYSIGGTVSGLTGSGLALQNNAADSLAVAGDGPFTFVTELLGGAAYAVTVSAQPTGQSCSVTNGIGTIATADITNVGVTCVDDVVPPPAQQAIPIPTLSQWALIILSLFLGLMVFANRRRLFL